MLLAVISQNLANKKTTDGVVLGVAKHVTY